VSDVPTESTAAGWYEQAGSLRYWDGGQWTDQMAPLPPSQTTLTQRQIANAVCLGVLAALFVVWLGAQISPDHIFLPVKFVVKELP